MAGPARVDPPLERLLDLPAGRFRALEWPGAEPAALFLHGLTGVAEVWGPTVDALGAERPRCVAFDQRGHGHSAKPANGYAVTDFVADTLGVIEALGLARPHLVGHSMGARVALVLAARHPEAIRSVSIVDIGPEAWKANWQETVAALDRMPATWPDAVSAIGGAARSRGAGSIDADAARAIALARLQALRDGSVTWLADREALKQTVIAHRSRDYWREWRSLRIPSVFVHGATSTEVRPRIAARMLSENPGVLYREYEGVGHNIPLLAPAQLATTIRGLWNSIDL